MKQFKKFIAALLAVVLTATAFSAIPTDAAGYDMTFKTHDALHYMGWRSGRNDITYGSAFKSVSNAYGITFEYYLKGLNNTEVRMYCLDVRLGSPAGADIMCQGSVASYYGTRAAHYLNGIAAFDQYGYKNSVVGKLSNQRHRESLTQLAFWYASQEIVRGGATSVTFNNYLFKEDVKTMLKLYGLNLAGLQGTWMSYKGLTWADVTSLTESELYELFATDYVTSSFSRTSAVV